MACSFLVCSVMCYDRRHPTKFFFILLRSETLSQHVLLALMWYWWFDSLPIRARIDLLFHLSFSLRSGYWGAIWFSWPKGMAGRKWIWLRWCYLFCHVVLCVKCPAPTWAWELPRSFRPGPQTQLWSLYFPLTHLLSLATFSSVDLSRTPQLWKIRLPLSLNFHIFGRERPQNFLDLWNHHHSFWEMEQSQEWTVLYFTQNPFSSLDSEFGGLSHRVISISVFWCYKSFEAGLLVSMKFSLFGYKGWDSIMPPVSLFNKTTATKTNPPCHFTSSIFCRFSFFVCVSSNDILGTIINNTVPLVDLNK